MRPFFYHMMRNPILLMFSFFSSLSHTGTKMILFYECVFHMSFLFSDISICHGQVYVNRESPIHCISLPRSTNHLRQVCVIAADLKSRSYRRGRQHRNSCHSLSPVPSHPDKTKLAESCTQMDLDCKYSSLVMMYLYETSGR